MRAVEKFSIEQVCVVGMGIPSPLRLLYYPWSAKSKIEGRNQKEPVLIHRRGKYHGGRL